MPQVSCEGAHVRQARCFVASDIRANDLEVCFRSISVSRTIGFAAVNRKLHATTLYGVYGDLTKVALWAVANKSPVFVEHSTAPIVELMTKSVDADTSGFESEVAEGFRQLQLITLTMNAAVSAGFIQASVGSQFMVGKCYEQLEPALAILVSRYDDRADPEEKRRHAARLIEFFEELYRSLRALSELLKNCDGPVVFNLASLIEDVLRHLVHLSIDTEDIGRRQDFERQLTWYTHLPGWFVEHAVSFNSSHAFDTLADIAPKTGLLLLHRQAWPTFPLDCAKAAFSITKQMLQKGKEGHAYDEPRHMLTVCYIGIVALKQGASGMGTAREIVGMIREFEALYRQRYFATWSPPDGGYVGPRPEQLRDEMLRWRDDFIRDRHGYAPLSDHSRDIVRQIVDDADIDRFIVEAWEVVPPNSAIEQELVERLGRRAGIRQLVGLLKSELTRRQGPDAS